MHLSVVDTANDGAATSPLRPDQSDKWPANAADSIPRPSDSGYWREQVPRQHNPRARTDSNGPSNPVPPIDKNPSSQSVPPGIGSIYDPPSPSVPPGFESFSGYHHSPSVPPVFESISGYHQSSSVPPGFESISGYHQSPSVPPGFESISDFHQSPSVPLGFESISGYHQSPSVPLGFESISPLPTSQAPYQGHRQEPTDGSGGTHVLNPASPSDSHSLRLDLPHDNSDLNSLSSFSLKFNSLSDSEFTSIPKHDAPPPNGPPQTVSLPDDPNSATSHISPLSPASPSRLSQYSPPYPPTSKFKSLTRILSMSTHDTPPDDTLLHDAPQHDNPPDGTPQIPSSPEDGYSSASWGATESHASSDASHSSDSWATDSFSSPGPWSPGSGSTGSRLPQHHVSPPASPQGLPQDHVPYPPSSQHNSLSEPKSMPTHDAPPPDGSPQIASSSDDSYSSSSWVATDTHPSSTSSTSSGSWSSESYSGLMGSKLEPSSEAMSTHTPDTQPLPPGPTDNRPPPAPPSDPGPSEEPNPPPSAKRPRPDEPDSWSSLGKILKGKFRRRFSD